MDSKRNLLPKSRFFCQTLLRRAERYPAEKYCPMVQIKNAAAGFTATGDQTTFRGNLFDDLEISWESLVLFRVKSSSVEGALLSVCSSSQKIHMIQVIDIE